MVPNPNLVIKKLKKKKKKKTSSRSFYLEFQVMLPGMRFSSESCITSLLNTIPAHFLHLNVRFTH